MKLSKAVGKNAHGQVASDVKLVQLALSAIKSCNKPYYKGKIDGKAGPQTICAIEGFQCDNKISVTGKVDTHGTTFNRLRQKTPMAMKNKLTKSGGGGTGVQGTLDTARVLRENDKLADIIKNKWPLPNKEALALSKAVKKSSGVIMVLLKLVQDPVAVDNAGRFVMRLDICDWGYDSSASGVNQRRMLVKSVKDYIAKETHFHKGENDMSISFKSAQAYPLLKGKNEKTSSEFIKVFGINNLSNDEVILNCIAQLEKTLAGEV